MNKIWLCAVLAAVAGAAMAQEAVQEQRTIEAPIWLAFAAPPRTDSFLPHEAEVAGTGGVVDLRCTARADGTLESCRVMDETPRGVGLGRSALTMTDLYKLRPRDRTGQLVEGGLVNFKVTFRCAGTCRNLNNEKGGGAAGRPGRGAGVGRGGRGR